MRRYLFLVAMFINFLVDMPLLLVVWIVSQFSESRSRKMAFAINRFTGLVMLWSSGAKFHPEGLDILKASNNCLYVANHRSMLDIPTVAKYIKRPAIFVAKGSVEKWPVMGWWIKVQGTLFIDRKSPKEGMKAIRKGIEMLKEGDSMVIFPEGTRSKEPGMLPFKRGSIRMAEKSGVPIIPIAIKGTDDVFENNGFNLKAKDIYFKVGEPININQVTLAEGQSTTEYVQQVIENMYNSIG